MKYCNGSFLLIVFLSITSVYFELSAQSTFNTEQIKNTYLSLPKSIQDQINKITAYPDSVLVIESEHVSGKVKYEYNRKNELTTLGLEVKNDAESEKYTDVLRFLENLFLNIMVAEKGDFILHFIMHHEIELIINNKTISKPSLSEWKNTINSVSTLPVAIRYSNSMIYASWILSEKSNVIIRFAPDLCLIRGMDKVEMEREFMQSLIEFKETPYLRLVDTVKIQEVKKGLYIFTGSAFETNDFRSDIYFVKTKDSDKHSFSLVFSPEFPAESFNNLFIYNHSNGLSIETTFMLYKNKKTVKTLNLNLLNTFLSYQCNTYFGLSDDTSDELRATVIYHNPLYNYVHMLVVQTNKKTLFSKADDLLKASLYLYIPRTDLRKNLQRDLIQE